MKGSRVFLRYWLPVVLWLAMIFVGSTDLLSVNRTSRILGPILRWLVPDISDAAIRRVQAVVRKGAHMAEYGVLALLLWRARQKPVRGEPHVWSWAEAGRILALCVLCAAADEFHQSFVASREGTVRDVLYDTAGAGVAMLLLLVLSLWRGRH